MSTIVISVWARWRDYVVEVRGLQPGEALWVGVPPTRLLRLSEDGTRVALGDESEVVLGVRQPLCLSHAGLDYTLLRSELNDAPAHRRLGGVPAFVDDCACLFTLLAVLLGGTRVAPAAIMTLTRDTSAPTAAPLFGGSRQRSPTLLIELDDASLAAPPPASGQMRCGDAEMGAPLPVAEARGRHGLRGPKDNADPHRLGEARAAAATRAIGQRSVRAPSHPCPVAVGGVTAPVSAHYAATKCGRPLGGAQTTPQLFRLRATPRVCDGATTQYRGVATRGTHVISRPMFVT